MGGRGPPFVGSPLERGNPPPRAAKVPTIVARASARPIIGHPAAVAEPAARSGSALTPPCRAGKAGHVACAGCPLLSKQLTRSTGTPSRPPGIRSCEPVDHGAAFSTGSPHH